MSPPPRPPHSVLEWTCDTLSSCPAASLHGGVHDAQTGNGGVSPQVQRSPKTQGSPLRPPPSQNGSFCQLPYFPDYKSLHRKVHSEPKKRRVSLKGSGLAHDATEEPGWAGVRLANATLSTCLVSSSPSSSSSHEQSLRELRLSQLNSSSLLKLTSLEFPTSLEADGALISIGSC